MKKVLLSWSSGKDSAWALHLLSQSQETQIVGLLTTINESANRVAMHAVRRMLLEAQAETLGLPLWVTPLPSPCPNTDYERIMREVCRRAVTEGIQAIALETFTWPMSAGIGNNNSRARV